MEHLGQMVQAEHREQVEHEERVEHLVQAVHQEVQVVVVHLVNKVIRVD